MARYYFHLRDGSDILLDPEGQELPDQQAIEACALKAARDTLSHDVEAGCLDLRPHLEVEDQDGKVVHRLELQDAVTILKRRCPRALTTLVIL